MSDMETRLREALQVLAGDVSGHTIQPDDLAALRSHQQRRRAAIAAVAAAALLVGAVVAGLSTVNRGGALDAPSAGSPTPSGSASISIYRSPSVSPIPSITSVKSIVGAVEPIDRYCPGAPTVGTCLAIRATANQPTSRPSPSRTPSSARSTRSSSNRPSLAPSRSGALPVAANPSVWACGQTEGCPAPPESVGTFCFSAVVRDRTGYATQPYIIIVTKASAP